MAVQGGVADGKLMKALEYACFMHTSKCVMLSKQIAERVNAHQLADKIQRLYDIKTEVESERLQSRIASASIEQPVSTAYAEIYFNF